MQLLQQFLVKGESTGIESLTTPIADPPKMDSAKITNPTNFLPNCKQYNKFYLVRGRNITNPTTPNTNPTHKLAPYVLALQTITKNYDKNNIAVTYSLGPCSKAYAKHKSHAKFNTLDNKPIPSNLMLNSCTFEVEKKTIRNKTLTKA